MNFPNLRIFFLSVHACMVALLPFKPQLDNERNKACRNLRWLDTIMEPPTPISSHFRIPHALKVRGYHTENV